MTNVRQSIILCTEDHQATTRSKAGFERRVKSMGMASHFESVLLENRTHCIVCDMFFVSQLRIFPDLTELILLSKFFGGIVTFLFTSPSLLDDFSTKTSMPALISSVAVISPVGCKQI
jgi:hypothetical protein